MGSCLFDLVLLMEADRWMPCKPVGVRLYTRAGTTSSSPAAKQIAPACRGVWAICFLWATRWVSASRRVQAAGRWRSRPLVLLHRNHELPVVSRWPWLSRQGLGACALPRGAAQVDPTPHDRSIWVRAVNASRTFQVSPLVSVRRVCVTIDISPGLRRRWCAYVLYVWMATSARQENMPPFFSRREIAGQVREDKLPRLCFRFLNLWE
jgi:hypothetical protein